MSRPKGVSNESSVCSQNLSEYVGLSNKELGFQGEPELKKHYKTQILPQPH